MKKSKKNILITGYNGFVGSNLTAALREYHLIGIDLFKGDSVDEHVDWTDIDSIENVDCVIHLAGKAHDVANTSDQQSYFDINLGLTKNIFDFFIKSNAEKFIFFSSVKAVADNVIGDVLTEDVKPDPLTPYGKSKLAAEEYIRCAIIPQGKSVYTLRPCMIHGPGNKGNLTLLYNVVKKGIPYPLGEFDNLRSFTSIGNLLFIITKLINDAIESGIYHIADDEPVSTNDIIGLISDSLRRKTRIWYISKKHIMIIAKMGDSFHFPLNSERLKKLTESYVVSNKKIMSALGEFKLPISAKEGLLQTFKSFIK
jgi:nucleoside-diphosphate-sugar epimerase